MCYNIVIALEVMEMVKKVLRSYAAYSPKQHGTPWVAFVGLDGKIDFTKKAGYYSGGSGTGHKGDIIVYSPKNEQVYAYGRKNYMRKEKAHGVNKDIFWVIYIDGKFKPCDRYGLLLDVWAMPKRLRHEYNYIIGKPHKK